MLTGLIVSEHLNIQVPETGTRIATSRNPHHPGVRGFEEHEESSETNIVTALSDLSAAICNCIYVRIQPHIITLSWTRVRNSDRDRHAPEVD